MSDDLPKRLREAATALNDGTAERLGYSNAAVAAIIFPAADEIERLRKVADAAQAHANVCPVNRVPHCEVEDSIIALDKALAQLEGGE